MARNEQQALKVRAQEILSKADKMSVSEAIAQAAMDVTGGDPLALARLVGAAGESMLKAAKKASYEIQDAPALFAAPELMYLHDPEIGDYVVRRDIATAEQYVAWLRDGSRYHSTQGLRFRRELKRHEKILKDRPEVREMQLWAAKAALAGEEVANGDRDA